MTIAKVEGAPALARWSARIALFALVLLAASIVLHRFFGMSTPVFLRLVLVSFIGAAMAIVLGIVTSVRIWRHGGPGAARAVVTFMVAGGILAWPLSVVPLARSMPELNDVTTAPASPPAFDTLAAQRKAPANPAAYPVRFAEVQAKAFPDLAPLLVNRSVDEAYDLVLVAVRRERMTIVKEQPPSEENGLTGVIEAVDRTTVLGFYDDVVLRVAGTSTEARIDIRSASRFGRHDFGRNVHRVRVLLRGIVQRLESTIPGSGGERVAKGRPTKPVKAGAARDAAKDADRKKAAPRP